MNLGHCEQPCVGVSLCRLIYPGFEISQFFVHLILRITKNQLTRAFADGCQLHQLRRPSDVVWDAVQDGDDEDPPPPPPTPRPVFFFSFFFNNFIVPHSYMPPVRGLAPGGLCLNITFYYIVIQWRIGYVNEREWEREEKKRKKKRIVRDKICWQ